MYKRDSTSEDKFYMKNIVGYDDEFNFKVKVWVIKFLCSITTKNHQKDYYAFRPDRIDFKQILHNEKAEAKRAVSRYQKIFMKERGTVMNVADVIEYSNKFS
jgi:hypothetical protein